MTGRVRRLATTAAVLLGFAALVRAEQTRLAVTDPSEMQRGEAQGVAVTSRGRLLLAPRISALGKTVADPAPAQVFAAAADPLGNFFLATGPDGCVIRVTAAGDTSVYFRAGEPLVTAILLLPGGDLLAATAPGGKIYRVRPDGKGSVWSETEERYVWALASTEDGAVFAATGERGRLLRIDRSGRATVTFDSDETHLVSLAPAGGGGVWAGGSGRGLVYRVDAEGHALVVYDDDLPEAKSIAIDAAGNLVAAFDAAPAVERRPPAVRIRVAGGAGAGAGSGASGDGVGDLDSREGPALQGVIEGLPAPSDEDAVRLRGRIVRISPDGAASELWRSSAEAPFALALDASGRPVFATGEPARLWRVDGPGEVALLATLKEAQATALASAGRALVVATSNPAATYRIDREPADGGTYLAPVSDAGGVARWGTLTWRADGPGGRVELFTRTGNAEDPDGTWSAWSPALTDALGSAVPNPEGRFLQWRARIAGAADGGPKIGSIAATYATRNRAPSLRDLRLEPASGAVAAKATVRWSAADPDGDGVAVDVQARPVGATDWKSAARTEPAAAKPSDPTLGNDGAARDGKAIWDTATWDEGLYQVRAVVSDQPANPPGEGLEAASDLPVLVRVDRTPPSIESKRGAGGALEVTVTDALSGVARLEVIEGGRVLFAPRCADGVCDGPRESFRLASSDAGTAGARSLRATDGAGNAAEAAVPAP